METPKSLVSNCMSAIVWARFVLRKDPQTDNYNLILIDHLCYQRQKEKGFGEGNVNERAPLEGLFFEVMSSV